ncbi:alpha/beta fold hydrolase [Pseudogemmobacter humi]|uniref:3-oxoadipate enol-lactonase 2 n=1 Tax=Pseudogemmobacter humi TaxID=2483812 RepID=A0A3P5X5K7_9RHOB|nr:alpha/beta hydrolase [Pseudogemmobacter humi]VDC29489.1 3-oxoadipate enol-lactonase 2 [Pseudogemmobacter humi]
MAAIDCAYTVTGEGPALFLIHGIGARRATFARLIEGLKDRFTCISYDLRGHGESPLPGGRFGLEDLVDDLEALRARLGVERAHFAGHSLGGMIGPAYARRYPDRVRSLGLWSTAAFRTEDDSAKVKAVVAAMREKGIGPVLDTLTARWFTDDFVAARPDVIEWRKRQVTDTPADIFLNVFDIYAETEMGPWLHEISIPAQVLTGELDGGCNPRLNTLIAGAMPQAELVILPGLKHAIFIEATDQVLPHVRRFLLAREAND